MERAQVIGRCLVVSEAGEAVLETIAPHRQAGYATRSAGNGKWSMPRKSMRVIDGLTLVLPVDAPAMSHFLFEGLSHLVAGMPDIENVVIGTSLHAGFSDLIAFALGKKVNVLYRPPELYEEAWSLERALVPIYRFNFHPEMVTSLENIVAACREENAETSGYLYVSRQDATHYRMMLNEDRIASLMSSIGFEVLELNNMAEVEIVRKFSSAKMIVGPVGAGLYNSIFSPPGCTVLVLCAPNYLRSFMDQCAALRGVQRAYCFGPDFLSYEAEQQGGHNDFVVDEDAVLETVLSLLEDAGNAFSPPMLRRKPVVRDSVSRDIWGRLFRKAR
jgi:capsular polysaccharide biosynthesis protein